MKAFDVPRCGDSDVVDVEMIEIVADFSRRQVEVLWMKAVHWITRVALLDYPNDEICMNMYALQKDKNPPADHHKPILHALRLSITNSDVTLQCYLIFTVITHNLLKVLKFCHLRLHLETFPLHILREARTIITMRSYTHTQYTN